MSRRTRRKVSQIWEESRRHLLVALFFILTQLTRWCTPMLSQVQAFVRCRLIQMSIFLSSRNIQMHPVFSAYQPSGQPLAELTRKFAMPVEQGGGWVCFLTGMTQAPRWPLGLLPTQREQGLFPCACPISPSQHHSVVAHGAIN